MGSGTSSGTGSGRGSSLISCGAKVGVCCGSGVGGAVEQTAGTEVKEGRMSSSCMGGKREMGDSQGDGLLG